MTVLGGPQWKPGSTQEKKQEPFHLWVTGPEDVGFVQSRDVSEVGAAVSREGGAPGQLRRAAGCAEAFRAPSYRIFISTFLSVIIMHTIYKLEYIRARELCVQNFILIAIFTLKQLTILKVACMMQTPPPLFLDPFEGDSQHADPSTRDTLRCTSCKRGHPPTCRKATTKTGT